MKIGILTQPLRNNYGGLLQNYALQTVLKRMGHEVWTIDRDVKANIFIKYGSIVKRIFLRLINKDVKVRVWMKKNELRLISKHTRHFIEKNINATTKIYSTRQLNKIVEGDNFDVIIVGSDQVWRPLFSPNIFDYFLEFSEKMNIKRVAYSASFGVDLWEFSEDETRKCSKLAKKFDAISVREDTGVKLCKDNLKVHAEHTLDPTMLLDKNNYLELIKSEKSPSNQGKLFVYILDKNDKKNNIISIVSQAKGLETFEVMPEIKAEKYYGKIKNINIEKCIYPPVEQWIKAFHDAEFVITDSFHGTVFSIIFGKPFISIVNNNRGSSRFYSLLKIFNLEERAITNISHLSDELLNNKIDFSKVNQKIILEQGKSMRFLYEYLTVL